MHSIINFMKSNEKEMWNIVEVHDNNFENGGYKINRWNLTNALKNHFGDSLVALSSPGVASILNFRKSWYFCLLNKNDIDDKDVKECPGCIKTETKTGHFKKF